MRKTDLHYSKGHRLIRSEKSRDQKDSREVKKIHNSFITNSNSEDKYKNQSD